MARGRLRRSNALRPLRVHRRHLAGGRNVLDYLFTRRVVRNAEGPPPKVAQWLQQYGQLPIAGLVVCRKPINSVIDAVLRGVLSPNAVPYDKLFHLWIHVHLAASPSKMLHFNFEKNEVVRVEQVAEFDPHQCDDHLTVSIGPQSPPLTLARMFDRALRRVGPNRLWVYDPVSQNCQRFVWDLLSSSNLGTPQLETFILQDINKALKGPGYYLARGATDLASFLRRLIGGKKMYGGQLDPEAQAILDSLPDWVEAKRTPESKQLQQARQALQARQDIASKAWLAELPLKAAQINPHRFGRFNPPAEMTQQENFYDAYDFKDFPLNVNYFSAAAPEPAFEELLPPDVADDEDELEGDGCLTCGKCKGAGCPGAIGGCFCHGDKYGIGTAVQPSSYLSGHHLEPNGGNFFTDIRDTFRTAFSKAGDILRDDLGRIPVIGTPLRAVGDVYKRISGGRRKRFYYK